MNNDYYEVQLSQFYNENTLNIFADASMLGQKGKQTGCYGAIAVIMDEKIDFTYRLVSNSTSNNSEIKGVRAAIDIANKYKNKYQFINIFCDNLVAINGLREYIYKWKYDKNTGTMRTGMGKEAANQEIFIEAHRMLNELEQAPCIIKLWHQSGHVTNGFESINSAADSFRRMNKIVGKVDINLIRYISVWNNYVDQTSRSLLKRNRLDHTNYMDPLIFYCPDGKL